eukprot:jgi/Mesvir1/15970/Mv08281-RA.2
MDVHANSAGAWIPFPCRCHYISHVVQRLHVLSGLQVLETRLQFGGVPQDLVPRHPCVADAGVGCGHVQHGEGVLGLDVAMSNTSFIYLDASFVEMVKPSSLVWVLLLSFAWGLKRPSGALLTCVLLILVGQFLISYNAVNFDVKGFFIVEFAAVMAAGRCVLIEVLLHGATLSRHLHTLEAIVLIMPGAALLLLLVLLLPYKSPVRVCSMFPDFCFPEASKHDYLSEADLLYYGWHTVKWKTTGILVLASGSLAFGLNLVEFVIINFSSALTLNVAGILKLVLVFAATTAAFNEPIALWQMAGLVCAMVGIIGYNWLNYMRAKSGCVATPKAARTGRYQELGEEFPDDVSVSAMDGLDISVHNADGAAGGNALQLVMTGGAGREMRELKDMEGGSEKGLVARTKRLIKKTGGLIKKKRGKDENGDERFTIGEYDDDDDDEYEMEDGEEVGNSRTGKGAAQSLLSKEEKEAHSADPSGGQHQASASKQQLAVSMKQTKQAEAEESRAAKEDSKNDSKKESKKGPAVAPPAVTPVETPASIGTAAGAPSPTKPAPLEEAKWSDDSEEETYVS